MMVSTEFRVMHYGCFTFEDETEPSDLVLRSSI